MASVTYSNEDLNRFYLQAIADYSLMVLNAFSPGETEDSKQAKTTADRFDALVIRANNTPTEEQMVQLNKDAFRAAQDFRRFILLIEKKVLTQDFHLDLKLTSLNNFVSQAEKYLDDLNMYMNNKMPKFDPIQLEIFWLPFFVSQSNYIASNVGDFQMENREKALHFADILNDYWTFSKVIKGMTRIGTDEFQMAIEHHKTVINVMNEYYEFLTALLELQRNSNMPGSMSNLYLDHSRRDTCFFLTLMDEYLGFPVPGCDPYAQRESSM